MLREFKELKQEPGNGSRRWFESDGFDLVVWYDERKEVSGFQLCYDFGRGEHAFTWRKSAGCSHHGVDSGDRSPTRDETPILVVDGAVPWAKLRQTFDARSQTLESGLRQLVRQVLVNG